MLGWMTIAAGVFLAAGAGGPEPRPQALPQPAESLNRGGVVLPLEGGRVFASWRLLGTDPEDVAFNLYRAAPGGPPERLTPQPLGGPTGWLGPGGPGLYFVRPVSDGREGPPSPPFLSPSAPVPYLSIPLRTLPGHTPNDAAVGDLDGDGRYEIVLKQEMSPRDNSQKGATGETKLEAYGLDGTFLWRINLGRNIREGAHYTPFIVYDLDGDGRSEVACRTSDGTVDGTGRVLGEAGADHRDPSGFILKGPEFLTIFEGATGRVLATAGYIPPRGDVRAWGDDYGNRSDRFLACVAYLDGVRPSLVLCRGCYTRIVLAAWNWRDGRLTHVWTFDSDADPASRAFRGQGSHNLAVGDVDGDGRDEILYGACTIDDDGKGLYTTGLGHGDALHLSDLDPDRPGLEVFSVHERPAHVNAAAFRDARTGAILWGKPSPDAGRGMAMDLDPRHRGCELWASGEGLEGLWDVGGERISARKPRSCNFGVWWDGDLLREILDGTSITKWDWERGIEIPLLRATGCSSNNGTKATPALCADLLGDWREEAVWRTEDGRELRIYTTPIPTPHRRVTLAHDRQYRLSMAWQNVGYNLPTQPGFFLGEGAETRRRAPARR